MAYSGKFDCTGFGRRHSPGCNFPLEYVICELVHNMVHAKNCGARQGHFILYCDDEAFYILQAQDSVLSDKNFEDLTKLYNSSNKDAGSMSAHGTGYLESLSRLNMDAVTLSRSSTDTPDEYATYKSKRQLWYQARKYWEKVDTASSDITEDYISRHYTQPHEEHRFADCMRHMDSMDVSTFVLETLRKTDFKTMFVFKMYKDFIEADQNNNDQYKIGPGGQYHLSDLFNGTLSIIDVEKVMNEYIASIGILDDFELYTNVVQNDSIRRQYDASSATPCVAIPAPNLEFKAECWSSTQLCFKQGQSVANKKYPSWVIRYSDDRGIHTLRPAVYINSSGDTRKGGSTPRIRTYCAYKTPLEVKKELEKVTEIKKRCSIFLRNQSEQFDNDTKKECFIELEFYKRSEEDQSAPGVQYRIVSQGMCKNPKYVRLVNETTRYAKGYHYNVDIVVNNKEEAKDNFVYNDTCLKAMESLGPDVILSHIISMIAKYRFEKDSATFSYDNQDYNDYRIFKSVPFKAEPFRANYFLYLRRIDANVSHENKQVLFLKVGYEGDATNRRYTTKEIQSAIKNSGLQTDEAAYDAEISTKCVTLVQKTLINTPLNEESENHAKKIETECLERINSFKDVCFVLKKNGKGRREYFWIYADDNKLFIKIRNCINEYAYRV